MISPPVSGENFTLLISGRGPGPPCKQSELVEDRIFMDFGVKSWTMIHEYSGFEIFI